MYDRSLHLVNGTHRFACNLLFDEPEMNIMVFRRNRMSKMTPRDFLSVRLMEDVYNEVMEYHKFLRDSCIEKDYKMCVISSNQLQMIEMVRECIVSVFGAEAYQQIKEENSICHAFVLNDAGFYIKNKQLFSREMEKIEKYLHRNVSKDISVSYRYSEGFSMINQFKMHQ